MSQSDESDLCLSTIRSVSDVSGGDLTRRKCPMTELSADQTLT